MEAATEFVVESPDVVYSPETIEAQYEYRTTSVSREGGVLKVGEGPSGGPQGWGSQGAGRERELPNVCDPRPSSSERGGACGSRLTPLPAPRCTPRPRASLSGPPGWCPGSGSCSSAGAATTAPH